VTVGYALLETWDTSQWAALHHWIEEMVIVNGETFIHEIRTARQQH